MPHAVIATLSEETGVWLEEVRTALGDYGLARPATAGDDLPPRVTLAVCETAQVGALSAWIETATDEMRPIRVRLGALGLFPGDYPLCALMVVPVPPLISLHQRLHREAGTFMRGRDPFFRPDAWLPHVPLGLATDGDMVRGVAESGLFGEDAAPREAIARSLDLYRLDPVEAVASHTFGT